MKKLHRLARVFAEQTGRWVGRIGKRVSFSQGVVRMWVVGGDGRVQESNKAEQRSLPGLVSIGLIRSAFAADLDLISV